MSGRDDIEGASHPRHDDLHARNLALVAVIKLNPVSTSDAQRERATPSETGA
jgi:hypothetical protein